MNITLLSKSTLSRVLHWYADIRVGATTPEKRCHKTSDSILLTFDDYGSAEQVHELIRILANKRVKAMFFIVGDWARENPQLVDSIRNAGHVIGNHTSTHTPLKGLPSIRIEEEIAHGIAARPWFRPPLGKYNKQVRAIAAKLGYLICYWSIDSRDWTGASGDEMKHTIMGELHPGAVILFHIHAPHTIALLPDLIDEIRQRGYRLTDSAEDWQPEVSQA